MAFCAFSTVGKGAMMGSNFVPAPTGLAYTASSATTTAVTISFSMASIAGTTTYTPSTGTGAGGPSAYIISTLSSNTPYTITLIAKNNGVSSKASTSVSVLTIPTSPTTLIYSSATTTTVVITFTVPAGTGTITSYGPSTGTGSGTSTGYTISGLVSNTTYSMTLTATNASGTSAASTALSVLTIPSPPTALTYSSATTTTVVITFTVPTGTGTITSYGPSTGTGSGTSTGYTISGLASNTTYSMTLTATNGSGTSAVSSALSVLTVPGPPTIGTATVTDATHVSVTFTAPSGTGAITGYTVTSNTGSFTGTGTSSPITVTGAFVSGTAYTFTVTATNASGTSTASSATASVTPNSVSSVNIAGLIWKVYYNNYGAGNYLSNGGVGTSGGGNAIALTIAPIGSTWSANNNPAITQNTGTVTDFTSLTTATNSIMTANLSSHKFSVEWTGYFLANATGTWTFYTTSDDGSWLWIDNDTTQTAYTGYNTTNVTVSNGPDQGMTTRSGTAVLTSGKYYFIRIQFNENGGGYDMNVNVTNPSGTVIGKVLTGYVFNNNITPILVPTGLLKYYKFNTGDIDGSGRLTNYAGGTSVKDATAYNSPTFSTTISKVGGSSLYLNGSNQYINIDAWTTTQTGITIKCWFYFISSGWTRLIDFGNGAGSSNILFSPQNGQSVFGPSGTTQPGSYGNWGDSSWHFIAWSMSCDNTTNNTGTWNFYIDNALINNRTNAAYPTPTSRSNNFIGFSNWSSDGYSNCYLNEFRFYTRVLDSTEMTTLYNYVAV